MLTIFATFLLKKLKRLISAIGSLNSASRRVCHLYESLNDILITTLFSVDVSSKMDVPNEMDSSTLSASIGDQPPLNVYARDFPLRQLKCRTQSPKRCQYPAKADLTKTAPPHQMYMMNMQSY